MNICILIPVYNEAGLIGKVVSGLHEKGYPVIVVDDGSSDGSAQEADRAGALVVMRKENKGKGYSLKEGFQEVLRLGYDGAIIMDGDGQHAINDLPLFLEKARTGQYGVVNGNRMDNPQGMPWIRIWTNRIMSSLVSWAAHQSIPDSQCGFRYLSASVLKALELKTDSFEIETEILIQSSKKGFKITSVPIQTIYGDEESKINPLRDTIRFIKYFFREMFSK